MAGGSRRLEPEPVCAIRGRPIAAVVGHSPGHPRSRLRANGYNAGPVSRAPARERRHKSNACSRTCACGFSGGLHRTRRSRRQMRSMRFCVRWCVRRSGSIDSSSRTSLRGHVLSSSSAIGFMTVAEPIPTPGASARHRGRPPARAPPRATGARGVSAPAIHWSLIGPAHRSGRFLSDRHPRVSAAVLRSRVVAKRSPVFESRWGRQASHQGGTRPPVALTFSSPWVCCVPGRGRGGRGRCADRSRR